MEAKRLPRDASKAVFAYCNLGAENLPEFQLSVRADPQLAVVRVAGSGLGIGFRMCQDGLGIKGLVKLRRLRLGDGGRSGTCHYEALHHPKL